MKATTESAKTKIEDSLDFERLRIEFSWVLRRLLEVFTLENISVWNWDYGHNLAVGAEGRKNGKRFRNAIKLIVDLPEGEYRFDQTPQNEKLLEKFIQTFKA